MRGPDNKNPTDSQPDRDLIAGRYRLTKRIGQGRLGEIFAAVDEKRERAGSRPHLAVQLVSDVVAASNSLFNKLRIGYQSLQAAGHPNIVRYRSLERDGNRVYLVMELLDGARLSYVIKGAGTIPLDEVRPVLRGIGDALQFLHAEGLVHGNLTARNVFITDKLDAQLLDVVPLDAANGIFRGATTSSSAGGTTIADDVFALASLAYQMLSGRRPFNHSTPARTGLAGREPDRIAGLDDDQWDALCRALTVDEDEDAYTVRDFLREFGVRGSEHLRAVYADPPAAEPVPDSAGQPPVVTREPAVFAAKVRSFPGKRPQPQAKAPEPGAWRAVMLSLVLVGLGGWYSFGQPGEQIADLTAYLDSRTNGVVTPQANVAKAKPEVEQTEIEQLEMLQPLPEHEVVAMSPEAATEPETVEPELVELIVEPAVVQGLVEEELIGPPAELSPEPETLVTDLAEAPAEAIDEATAEPVAEEPVVDEPKVGFTESVAVVSEQSAMAQVRLWRETEFQRPLVWWTSDSTARADADYVIVPERAVDLEYGGTLNIPLVNDNLPEQRESFYVDVGVREPQGHIERLASIRVDIVDDDLR